MKALLTAAIALLSVGGLPGCSGPSPALATGEGVELIKEGLSPLIHSGFSRAWLRPGISFANYERFVLVSGQIFYRHPPGTSRDTLGGSTGDNFALPAEMKANLEESFRRTLENEITRGGEFRSVEARGEGVLLVRALLGDLVVNVPLDGLGGDDLIFVDSIGAITLLVELYDAETGQLIGRLLERRSVKSDSNRPVRARVGDATFEMNRIFQNWAKSVRSLLFAIRDSNFTA